MARVAAIWSLLVLPVLAGTSTPRPERVTYKTPDGVQIVADYYAPKTTSQDRAPIVIMLHQYPSTRSSWAPIVPLFYQAGYAVLAPDLRGHGDSVEPRSMYLERGRKSQDTKHYRAAYQDVLGAYEWLRGRKEVDRSRFALIGASIGTSVSIAYAALDKSVDVVVCLSPGTNYFGVDSKRDIKRCRDRPILLISPRKERTRSETLGAAAKNATVKIIEDSDKHGTFMFGQVPGIEKTVFEFVQAHIGKPTKHPVVASVKSNKYHETTCGYAKPGGGRYAIKTENLRVFSSAAEAKARGYTPCKRCGKSKTKSR